MIDFLFNPKGRVSKKGLAVFIAAMFALNYVFGFIVANQLIPAAGTVTGILSLILLWAKFAVPAKRLHDASRSGWWVMLAIPLIVGAVIWAGMTAVLSVHSMDELASGIEPDMEAIEAAMQSGVASTQLMVARYGGLILSLLLLLLPATNGDNKYGSDPAKSDGLGFGS